MGTETELAATASRWCRTSNSGTAPVAAHSTQWSDALCCCVGASWSSCTHFTPEVAQTSIHRLEASAAAPPSAGSRVCSSSASSSSPARYRRRMRRNVMAVKVSTSGGKAMWRRCANSRVSAYCRLLIQVFFAVQSRDFCCPSAGAMGTAAEVSIHYIA